jgi:hypothetical protein
MEEKCRVSACACFASSHHSLQGYRLEPSPGHTWRGSTPASVLHIVNNIHQHADNPRRGLESGRQLFVGTSNMKVPGTYLHVEDHFQWTRFTQRVYVHNAGLILTKIHYKFVGVLRLPD